MYEFPDIIKVLVFICAIHIGIKQFIKDYLYFYQKKIEKDNSAQKINN